MVASARATSAPRSTRKTCSPGKAARRAERYSPFQRRRAAGVRLTSGSARARRPAVRGLDRNRPRRRVRHQAGNGLLGPNSSLSQGRCPHGSWSRGLEQLGRAAALRLPCRAGQGRQVPRRQIKIGRRPVAWADRRRPGRGDQVVFASEIGGGDGR